MNLRSHANLARAISFMVLALGFYSCKFRDDVSDLAEAPKAPGQGAVKLPRELTVNVDPASGKIDFAFYPSSFELSPGTSVEVVFGAGVVKDLSAKVDCAALPNRVEHTIKPRTADESATLERLELRIDPLALASPFRPDPEGDAKADMRSLTKGHSVRLEACLRASGEDLGVVAVDPYEADHSESELSRYAKLCEERLGALPAVSCLDDELFRDLPVRATGKVEGESASTPTTHCDLPSYLPTGDSLHCKPGARVARLVIKGKGEKRGSEAAIMCRKYWLPGYPTPEGPRSKSFNDVAIIQHDPKSGETCFYQALGDLDGSRVPSPRDQDAGSFWLAPRQTASINCIGCHDADPFVHTPFVDQAVQGDGEPLVPSRPFSPYVVLGPQFGFAAWPKTYAVKPQGGEECVACHRIGSLQGCETLTGDATGIDLAQRSSRTLSGLTFPKTHWMPPSHEAYGIATPSEWHDTFKEAADAFRRCCTLSDATGKRILGEMGRFKGLSRYDRRGLGSEQLQALKKAGCLTLPITAGLQDVDGGKPEGN